MLFVSIIGLLLNISGFIYVKNQYNNMLEEEKE